MGLAEFGHFWTIFSHFKNERISKTRCQAIANNDGLALTANGQRM